MNYIKLIASEPVTSKVLLNNNGFSKRAITEIFAEGYKINGRKIKNNKNLNKNDEIFITVEDEELDYEAVAADLDIVYEDENILVVNKKSGITVNSKNQISLANHLAHYFQENDIRAKIRFINRLDMNTSGLLMVAKNKFAQGFYQKQIEDNIFKKFYLALVEKSLSIDKLIEVKLGYDEETKRYDVSDKGPIAKTILKTSEIVNASYSKIEAQILTGKTHQIRSTLASLGHPIIGDSLYGSCYEMDRFLLHCYKIEFIRFLDGEKISLTAEPDFSKINSFN